MLATGLVAGRLTCEPCQTCGQVLTSSRRCERHFDFGVHTASQPPYVTRACMVRDPPEQSCATPRVCLCMQASNTIVSGRRSRSVAALQPGSLPSLWSAPPVAPLRATSCGTARRDSSAKLWATEHRLRRSVYPQRGRGARVLPAHSSGALQPLSAANAAKGPAFGFQQSRGRSGGRLHSRAAGSGSTAGSTAQAGPAEAGSMNGKHSFLSGYDDAWDSGSNGVGGHPPVAVITTLGCPHCKRV